MGWGLFKGLNESPYKETSVTPNSGHRLVFVFSIVICTFVREHNITCHCP